MKIGLDWSGVIAFKHEATRLLLMEMYAKFENDVPVNGPFLGRDDVVPFSPEYRKLFEQIVFGRAPIFDFTKDWVLEEKSDDTLLTVTEEEYEAMKAVLYERPEYALNIPEVPGAVAAIKQLIAYGHEVTIVTSRGPGGLPQQVVEDWCKKQELDVPIVFGAKDKTSLLQEYDLFVDDKKRQLAPDNDVLDTIRILFMHRYNVADTTDFIYAENCGYIAGWEGILTWIAWQKKTSLWQSVRNFLQEIVCEISLLLKK